MRIAGTRRNVILAVAVSVAVGATGCAMVNSDEPAPGADATAEPGACPFMIDLEWDGLTGEANSSAAIRSMIEWNRAQNAKEIATPPGSVLAGTQLDLLESALDDVSSAEKAQATKTYADRYLETQAVSESGVTLGRVTTEKFAGGWVVTNMTFYDTDPALGLCDSEPSAGE